MLSMEEAYLLGAYIGDGHAQWNIDNIGHPSYQFVMPSIDLDLLKKTSRCIQTIFPELKGRIKVSLEPHTGKTKGYVIRIVCHSKELCKYLKDKTDTKQKLPVIKDERVFKEFTAGLMDTDGWITEWVNKKNPLDVRYQMGFATTLPWYKQFKSWMQHSGVSVGKLQEQKKYNDNWATCYRMYFNIPSWVDSGFYFSIVRKQSRIENWKTFIRHSTNPQRPEVSLLDD